MYEDYFKTDCPCHKMNRKTLLNTWHNEDCLLFDYECEVVWLDRLVNKHFQELLEERVTHASR